MGDPRRPRKKYKRPKKLYDAARIAEEKELVKKYGLKNRKEIWKAEAKLKKIREQAKKMILHPEKQQDFLKRLASLGLIKNDATLDDVLALTKENILERRLQTVVFRKNLARTIREARQLITHRKIKIGGRICDVPGRIIKIEEEKEITKK
ncbi:MAG: 30S ribosomal protein S4 [Candidatus Pacearchaeota archaeon]|nr:30S ribosomal protein S4 [Candidatus Pacearchaeota archaeon]